MNRKLFSRLLDAVTHSGPGYNIMPPGCHPCDCCGDPSAHRGPDNKNIPGIGPNKGNLKKGDIRWVVPPKKEV